MDVSKQFSKDSDYDLLEIMTWKDTDEISAKYAWAEFYNRHDKYLYGVLMRSIKNISIELAEDVTSETFMRVFEKGAKTFRPSDTSNPDEIRWHVRSWLGQIAHKICCDIFRGKKINEVLIPYDEIDNKKIFYKGDENSENIVDMEMIERILEPRERDILHIAFMYYDPANPNRKLPNEILDEICFQWGITRANFRQIKKRAIEKIKANYHFHDDKELKELDYERK